LADSARSTRSHQGMAVHAAVALATAAYAVAGDASAPALGVAASVSRCLGIVRWVLPPGECIITTDSDWQVTVGQIHLGG
jgi:hypothetical protein